jgi:hypothetical protein
MANFLTDLLLVSEEGLYSVKLVTANKIESRKVVCAKIFLRQWTKFNVVLVYNEQDLFSYTSQNERKRVR